MAFLIEQGADVQVVSNGPNGKHWSPLKLAHYHVASQKTLELLTSKIETSFGSELRVDDASQERLSTKRSAVMIVQL